jgi:uncharacterized delta-60 repeat protein
MKQLNHHRIVAILSITILLPFILTGQTNTIKKIIDMGTNYDYSYSIALQNDRKVIIAGGDGSSVFLIRIDTTRELDNSFGNGGKVYCSFCNMYTFKKVDFKIQTDNKIVLGSSYFDDSTSLASLLVARFNSNGSLDSSFGTFGKVISPIGNYYSYCNGIAILPDGKILASGSANDSIFNNNGFDFALRKFNNDGTIDTAFGQQGAATTHIGATNNEAKAVAIQTDGKIIQVGVTRDDIYGFDDCVIVRYNQDGSLDSSFNQTGIIRISLSESYDFATSVIIQEDNKILIAGSAQNTLYNYNLALIRFNIDGTLDSTFGTNGIVLTDLSGGDFGNSVALQPNGKIILAGSTRIEDNSSFVTVCYNTDGTLDDTFGLDGIISTSFGNGDSEGMAVTVLDFDEIIIAGWCNNGTPGNFNSDVALARLYFIFSVGLTNYKENPLGIIVYPNPIYHDFYINYILELPQNITIKLIDIQGKTLQVLLENSFKQPGKYSDHFIIDRNISPGTYFIEISTQELKKSIKVVKH